MNSNNNSSSSINFLSVLQAVLMGLKMANLLDWPWKLVLFPTWIELVIIVIALIIYLVTEDL